MEDGGFADMNMGGAAVVHVDLVAVIYGDIFCVSQFAGA